MDEDETAETETTDEVDQESTDGASVDESSDTDSQNGESADGTGDEDNESDEQDTDRDDAPEWALKEIRRLRDENATRRTKFKEMKAQLDAAPSADELTTTKNDNAALLRENVALKAGLPDALAKALQGSTREELEARAKELQPFTRGGGTRDVRGGLDPDDDASLSDVQSAVERARKRRGII